MKNSDEKQRLAFGKAVTLGWKNIFNFQGKANRSEHWWWVLFVALFTLALMIVVSVVSLFMPVEYIDEESIGRELTLMVFMGGGAMCLFLLPLLLISSQIRRFHDVGKTIVIPIFGLSLYMISLICLCGAVGSDIFLEALHINGDEETASEILLVVAIINALETVVFSIFTIIVCLKRGKQASLSST